MEKPVKEVQMQFTRRVPLFDHVCPVWNTTFQGAKIAVYCSVPCRKKAAWQRHGKEYNANRKKGQE